MNNIPNNPVSLATTNTGVYAKLQFWFQKIPKDYRTAFIATFVIGMLTHLFVYMNGLFIGDGMYYNYYLPVSIYGTRWLAYILTIPFDYLNLGWAVGIVELFFISISVFILFRFFNLRSIVSKFLVTALVVTFPTVTATHAYLASAHAYAFAMLLSIIATYAICYMQRKWVGIAIAVLCLILASSCYQAYICCTATLMIFHLLMNIIVNGLPIKKVLLAGVRYLLAILVSVVLYYMLIYALATLGGGTADVRGIDGAGVLGRTFYESIERLYFTFINSFKFYLQYGYRSFQSFSTIIVCWVMTIVSAGLAIAIGRKKKTLTIGRVILSIVFLALLPFTLNIFEFLLNPIHGFHILMRFSFCLPYIFVVYLTELLQDLFPSQKRLSASTVAGWVLVASLAIVIFNQWILAHTAYTGMNKAYNESMMQANRIVSTIQATEGYTTETPVLYIGQFSPANTPPERPRFERLRHMVGAGSPLAYYNMQGYFIVFHMEQLNVVFSDPLPEQREALLEDTRVLEMPVYPNSGYVQMIDGVIVVRLSE